jgi:uncharacterized protein (TIGR02145 family)
LFAKLATFGLALAFIFSACSSEDPAPPPSPGGEPNNNQNGSGTQSPTCGSVQYNPDTEQCCGDSKYTTHTQFCSGGTVYEKCGGYEYNPSTNFCSGNTAYAKCGGSVQYNPSTEQCCGRDKFTTSTQFCSNLWLNTETVYDKCGGSVQYDPSKERCCGSSKYNTYSQFCSGSKVYDNCGRVDYDPSTEQCCGGSGISGSKFTISTQYCSDGTVKNYVFLTDSYDGKKYKTVVIGTQTWMAENIAYNGGDNKCYDNKLDNCNTYGRLYTWTTAKLACPSGWHLPSNTEWTTLVNSVGGLSTAGTKLKAKSGWLGTDDYSFSALPGGAGNADGSFSNLGFSGYWWSSTESSTTGAYVYDMSYNSAAIGSSNFSKGIFASVRCVKD